MGEQQIPYGYCHCGCGRKTNIATQTDNRIGHKKGEPVRFILGHARRKTPMPDSRYEVDPVTGGWNWLLAIDEDGYAVWSRRSQGSKRAARVMYEQTYGPLLDNLMPDHLCRNRRCVNPAHLEAVTNTENLRRGASTKLTQEEVETIRSLRGTKTQAELAKQFGVNPSTISRILAGKRWNVE